MEWESGALRKDAAPHTNGGATFAPGRGDADTVALARGDDTVVLSQADAPRLANANAGDHSLIHALLRVVRQAPSYEDFLTWLDEPSYEPSDRLLVKHGDRIVGHAHVLHRMAWFEGVKLPVGGVLDLAILPEFDQFGYDRRLLRAVEDAMRESQAILSIVRTDCPAAFRGVGWQDVAVQGYSQASVGDVLAHLAARAPVRTRRQAGLHVRLWRHVELDALRAVQRTAAAQQWGALYRAEHYWQWLVGRKAHSELIVAVDGPDAWDDLQSASHIVGYAVTHGSRVLEVCCLPDYARAAPRLLVRACQDAIERDYHTISLHTPASDPLHELMVTAGGTWCGNGSGPDGTLLVKLLDPVRWVDALYPVLRRRAKGAGLARPCEVCFHVGDEQFRLVLTRRSSRLVADEATSADASCDAAAFAALLVGNLNVRAAHKQGRLQVADEDVLEKLAVLFPPVLLWQSQFDVLRF